MKVCTLDRRWAAATLAPTIILAACLVLFATAPKDGDFWYSDAPRHALNGVFVKDFLIALPWHDPAGWAIDYYLKYPALTILFYPPLFYLFEAAAYTAFGVSQWTAQLTVAGFYGALGIGAYLIALQFMPRPHATGAALLTVGAPAIAFWGRQVMLDIPACAALAFSSHFFARYMARDATRDIVLCVVFVIAAVYIKFNSVFVLPLYALVFVARKGFDKRIVTIVILTVLALLPAIYLTIKFGAVNIQSITGRPGDTPRASAAAWLFYPEQLPKLLGWPTLLLAIAGAIVAFTGKNPVPRCWPLGLALGWLIIGYLFTSAIGVREARHFLIVILPLPILAGYALHALLPRAVSGIIACALGLGMVAYSALAYLPPATTGYKAAADYVAEQAPRGGFVLFSGNRDGTFIFNMRTHDERRDLSFLRADKLFLRVAIERLRGIDQTAYSEDQIAMILRERGIGMVVAQDEFWNDLDQMAKLESVLHRPEFTLLTRFAVIDPGHPENKSVSIYRPNYVIQPPRQGIGFDMPIIGRRFDSRAP
jgi:hypothetical protein